MSAKWAGIASRLQVWKKDGQVAPHKPLLLLLILSQARRREPNCFPYAEIDGPLRKLLREFGPSRESYHPEYPFQYLQSDGIWMLDGTEGLQPRKEKNQLPKRQLLRANMLGRVPERLWKFSIPASGWRTRVSAKVWKWRTSFSARCFDRINMPTSMFHTCAASVKFTEDTNAVAFISVCSLIVPGSPLSGVDMPIITKARA
jgi:hypothetical protein